MSAGVLATVLPVVGQITDLLQKDPDPEAVSKAGAVQSSTQVAEASSLTLCAQKY